MCGAPEGTYRYEPVWEVCQAMRVVVEKQNGTYKPDNYPYRGAHLWGSTIRR